MVTKSLQTSALSDLCSQDQLDLLNSIDSLRSQGISHYVSLPQIIVCGDQSSGKSSVLEAISGVSFPIKSNLCTRFPTELVLRKTSHIGVTVTIVPHNSRNDSERMALGSFRENLEAFDGLPALIESAKAAMAISTHGRAFSKDLLRIEVSGPDRPHLTIVDLPGLIHSETKQQSASDVELVQEVVQSYMKEPRSIILAVISAKNDFANQIVLKLARAADKTGNRTLGVITKPDTLIPGSESEAMYVSLARNQEVEFRLGWHILKNLDSEAGSRSLAERDVSENDFFSKGIWQGMSRSLLGVEALRKRLSTVLLRQITTELPSLIEEIGVKHKACSQLLTKLGEPRATSEEQRSYLLNIGQAFQFVVKAAVDGIYNDEFFGRATSKIGYQKRIRAVVQNLSEDFAQTIMERGHHCQITDTAEEVESRGPATTSTREAFMDHIQHLMKRTRGRELPGTFNPMIVADLFLEQAAPWEAITRNYVEDVWKATKRLLKHATDHVADTATSKALFQKLFEPALDGILSKLAIRSTALLKPHQKGHPITYSRDFIETLQEVRKKRNEKECTKILKSFFVHTSLKTGSLGSTDFRPLVNALVENSPPDLNRSACSEALDCMQAYYNVALKRFIDDIAVEVIEKELISQLLHIFSPVAVSVMSLELVDGIAGESEENRTQREELNKQLDVLKKGSETCKRFIGIKILDVENTLPGRESWFDVSNDNTVDSDDSPENESEEDVKSLSDTSDVQIVTPDPLTVDAEVETDVKKEEEVEEVEQADQNEDEGWAIPKKEKTKVGKKGIKGKTSRLREQGVDEVNEPAIATF